MGAGVLLFEGVELIFGGEFAVDEEEADFEEAGLFCELFDGYASVLENSFVSVDVGDA